MGSSRPTALACQATHRFLLLFFAFLSPVACLRADLESDFHQPPLSVGPHAWWHWMGSCFSQEGITKDLEAMCAAGIGGATVFNITSSAHEMPSPILGWPRTENTYRSQAYWDALAHAAREAGRLGLELGLHNTIGYSATGGPWITRERGMQRIAWSETRLSGETEGKNPRLPRSAPHDVAVLAVPSEGTVEPSAVLNLTSRLRTDDTLDWSPPPGAWTVYRFGYGPTCTGPRFVPEDVIGAMEADKMSAVQTRFHWEEVLRPLQEKLGADFGRSFRHVLIDSYEVGVQTWTPDFREEFLRRKGYDPIPWLVSLGHPITQDKSNRARRVLGDEKRTARFEFDYREVVADLYHENGWEPALAQIHQAGLTLNFEPYGGPFDTVAGAALADLPMGEFWTHSNQGVMPEVVAGARAAGKRVIGAESFTALPQNSLWNETPAKLRASADGAFLSGANRIVLHHWVHQPLDDRWRPGFGMGWWGVHFGRNQTWFEPGKAFFAYLGRVQSLLQRGEQTIDVLSVGSVVEGGDAIPNSVFLRNLKLDGGRFVTPANRSYPLLVIPHEGALKPEALRRIGELVRGGGSVVCARPTHSPSLQNYPECDTEVARLAAELWGDANEPVRTLGSGRLFADGDLQRALRALGLAQPLAIASGSNASEVRVLERRDDSAGARFFFVANQSKNAASATLSFRVSGLLPELWDADDGTIRPAPNWRQREGRTEVDLSFPGLDSVFVVFRSPTDAKGASAPEPVEIASSGIEGPWRLEFPADAGGGRTLTLPRLTSWTEQEDQAVRFFSGSATYRTTLQINPDWLAKGRLLRLDLGQVADLATVRLNGQPLGVLWCPPYRVDLGQAARPGENLLEIVVTNTWHNRLVGDEHEPSDLEWGQARKCGGVDVGRSLARFPGWLFDNTPRPSAGRTTFVTWNYFKQEEPLLPAGLLGPVRLGCLAPPASSP